MALSEPLTLPSGLVLPNRLVKAAMAENLMPVNVHIPGEPYDTTYEQWAEGEWGMILTGNVSVSQRFNSGPNDLWVYSPADTNDEVLAGYKAYADAAQKHGTPAVMQLVHPGRQSVSGVGKAKFSEKRVSASDVKLNLGTNFVGRILNSLIFGTPRPLTVEEISGPGGIVEEFVNGGIMAQKAGFAGIELHGAHGYLLAQFLSPETNLRNDAYGGTPAKRATIVVEIIKRMRAAVGKNFTIGIKLNSADASQSETTDDVVQQVQLMVDAGIDFIEVSGGTYERTYMSGAYFDPEKGNNDISNAGAKPDAGSASTEKRTASTPAPSSTGPGGLKQSTIKREAYFLDFTRELRARFPDVVLMVTGGFRTRRGMRDAVESGATNLVGIARPATVFPQLPRDIILNPDLSDDNATVTLHTPPAPWYIRLVPLKLVASGFSTIYYGSKIKLMAAHSLVVGQQ